MAKTVNRSSMLGSFEFSDIFDIFIANYEGDFKATTDFIESCPQPGKIINLGAGGGRIIKADILRTMTLVEPDNAAFRLLQRRAKKTIHEVIHAATFETRLTDGCAAGVFLNSNDIAEQSPILFTVAEISRLLFSGGRLFFSIHNPNHKVGFGKGIRLFQVGHDFLTVQVDTYPAPAWGEFGFESILNARFINLRKSWTIRQVFPEIELWVKILNSQNMSINSITDFFSNHTAQTTSPVMSLVAIKNEPTKMNSSDFYRGIKNYYDSLAPTYSQIVEQVDYVVPKWLETEISNLKGANVDVLDLGCGDGLVGKILTKSKLSHRTFGIDLSKEMVDLANASGNYKLAIVANLADEILIPEENFFDIVTSCGTLEFVPNVNQLLKKVRKVLALGGRFYCTLEKTMPDCIPKGSPDPSTGVPRWHYTNDEVVQLFREAGLEIEAIYEKPAYVAINSKRQVFYHLITARRRSL